jgi:uncharacterized integral membrane protein (TIGR00698 family)
VTSTVPHDPRFRRQQPQAQPQPAPGSAPAPRASLSSRVTAIAPGLALALSVALVATVIGKAVPVVGSAVPGAVIGAILAIIRKPGSRFAPGLKWASSFVLQCSVVILGTQLSIGAAARVGLASLPVMLGTLAVCLTAAYVYGRLLGVVGDLRTLIGVGTGICGASAIAAVSPVIEATTTDIGYAVSTIFLFNIAAVLAFPLLGHAIGMSQHSFGLFAGTAVNDTSSVVATASTYGSQAADYAIVVKLVRTLMIIPICIALAWMTDRKKAAATGSPGAAPAAPRLSPRRVLRLVPWFLIGFVAAALINTAGLIPSGAHGSLSDVSLFFVAVALSAIGLSTDVAALRRAGARPVVLGALLWVTVGAASLGLQSLTGTLH